MEFTRVNRQTLACIFMDYFRIQLSRPMRNTPASLTKLSYDYGCHLHISLKVVSGEHKCLPVKR